MRIVGADENYIAAGKSYFTVNTNIQYIDECHAGDAITVTSKILLGEGKKLKLAHLMRHENGRVLGFYPVQSNSCYMLI